MTSDKGVRIERTGGDGRVGNGLATPQRHREAPELGDAGDGAATGPSIASSGRLPLRRRARGSLVTTGSLAVCLLVWWGLAEWVFPPILFASPARTVRAFVSMAGSGELFQHIGSSLARIWAGFLLGSAVAIPAGLLMGTVSWTRRALEPYVEFFRFIPPIAFLPLAILWFGIGETSKIFLIFYCTVWIVLLNTMAGIFAIDPTKLRAARSLGFGQRDLFTRVMAPSSVPYIVTGMRIGMGNSFMTVVAAEMLAANTGIGYVIFSSRLFYQTDKMFVGLILLGVLGLLTDRLFRKLSGRLFGRYGVRDQVRER